MTYFTPRSNLVAHWDEDCRDVGGQVGCERRSAFVKFQKKNWGGGGVGLVGDQGGCEWRSESFVKIQKKKNGGGGSGCRGGGSGWM